MSQTGTFAGWRIAVAGGGQGIGAACARAFAREGARLVLCARTAADVERLAAELRAEDLQALAVAADLSTDAGADELARSAFTALGGLDLAIIAVGAAHRRLPVHEVRRQLALEQLAQNAVAPLLTAGALLRRWADQPRSADRDRHLLFLSSLVTRRPPMAGTAPYTAAKAALEAFVRAIAEEAWPDVRANALCLPAVATRLHRHAGTPAEELARFPSADEVAPLVLEAAGPTARGITGRAIDAEALAGDAPAALAGEGLLAGVRALQPFLHAGLSDPALVPEAEPGRRPSVRVRRAVRATAAGLNRYPDPGARLAARLEDLHGAERGGVVLSGGGASELLERTLRAACRAGDEVVSPFPTFEMLWALCGRLGLRHRPVPARQLADGLFAPHEAAPLLAALGPRTRIVYVATPDNPTGALLGGDEEARLHRALPPSVWLVVDEAWAGPPQPSPAPRDGAPVVRLRSFSKLQGLAALRIGYAVGPPAAIDLLRRLQLPYPLGAPQLAAAEAVLDQPERTRRTALIIARERRRLADGLRELGLAVTAGDAPVLLIREPSGRSAGRLLFALQAAGATVQEAHWDPAALVLALGSRADHRAFLAAARRARA